MYNVCTYIIQCFVKGLNEENNRTSGQIYSTFGWGGKLGRYVPENWKFPSNLPLNTLWILWHHGNAQEKIRPNKKIADDHSDDLSSKNDRWNLYKSKKVMKLIENIAIKHRYIESNVNFSNMTIEACNDIFNKVFTLLIRELYGAKSSSLRPNTSTCLTIYNQITKKRKWNYNDNFEE